MSYEKTLRFLTAMKGLIYMIKMHSRIAAAFLVMAMLFAMLPANAFAASDSANQTGETTAQVSNDELEISGTNSFGELVASTIEDYNDGEYSDDAATREYSVTDIEMNGTTATVEYGAQRDCTLVVAIYDEDGIKMLGSGKTDVTADAQLAEVEVSISEMPQYYLVKAFLLNSATNAPLSKVYTCELYTEAIQNIKNATMDDFADRGILNLDDSTETNFAVYGEDVIVITQDEGGDDGYGNYIPSFNVYDEAQSDSSAGKYVFHNGDLRFAYLNKGDVISYERDEDVIILKVDSVKVIAESDGTNTYIITEDKDIEMQDVFDYVKIENNGKIENYEVDYDNSSSCVYPIEDTISTYAVEVDGTFDFVDITFGIEIPEDEDDEDDDKDKDKHKVEVDAGVEFKAGMNLKISLDVKLYLSLSEIYIDVGLDPEISGEISVSGELSIKGKNAIKIAHFSATWMGITVECNPKVEFKITGKVSFNFTITAHIGFKVDKNGIENSSSWPKAEIGVEFEGTIFVGLNLEPEIKFISEKIAYTSTSGSLGLELKGTMDTLKLKTDDSEKHLCDACIDGDLNVVFEITVTAKLFNNKHLTYERDIVPKATVKLFDWYWSMTYGEFKLFKTCPHISYKVNITVKDHNDNVVEGASIYRVNDDLSEELLGTTDSSGKCEVYLIKGDNTLSIRKDEFLLNVCYKIEKSMDLPIKLDMRYEITVNVTDEAGNAISGALLYSDRGTFSELLGKTDSSGKCVLKLPKGTLDLSVISGDSSYKGCFEIDQAKTITVKLSVENTDDNGTIVTSGECGDNLTYTLYDSGLLLISGSGDMYDYSEYPMWESYREQIKSVEFNGQITSIGVAVFKRCSSLTSLVIPNSVTSIGQYALAGCESLEHLVIPASVTSIGSSAFFYGVEGLDGSIWLICDKITSAGPIGSGCNYEFGWTENIPKNAFSHLDNLNCVTIPNSVTSIGEMAFWECQNLTDVYYAGSEEDWKNISISNYNSFLTDSTIHYNYMSTSEAEVSEEETSTLSSSTGRSSGSNSGLQVSSTIIDSGTCGDNLSWTLDDNGLLTISGRGKMKGYASYKKTPWYNNRNNIKNIKFNGNVTSIGNSAFCACESLTSVTIPNSVTSIEGQAFYECGSLTNITIPNSVTSIGGQAFRNCSSLISVAIPNSVTTIGYSAFCGCDSLTSVTIPNSVTSIGEQAFGSCDSLTNIVLPSSITSIDNYTFSGCSNLKSITIPKSVTSIGNHAFYSCGNLKSITIPKSVTYIDSDAFRGCSSLSDIYYTGTKDEWNSMKISIGNSNLLNATIHYVLKQTFNNLVPGTDYVMAAVKSDTADDIFAADNLLYIDQKTAGDSGTLTFAYELREEYEGAVIKIFGTARTDIADAVVTASKLPYTGEMQSPSVTVTLNGEKLVKDADYTLSGTTEATDAGTYTFTVIGIGDYKGTVEGEFEITATEIKTNVTEITMLKGTTFATQVWRYPEASTDKITYTSSDDSIATVDENGFITAVAKGKATITATAESGNSAQIKVTTLDSLRRSTTSIVIKKSAVTLTIKRSKLNPTVGLSASIKGDSTGKLWYSDNINVATVSKNGKVTAVGEGTANIYCRTADGSTGEPCVVTVNAFRIDSDNMRNNIIYVNAGDKCSVALTNTSASGDITWKSSNTKRASIDANGNVTALKKGTVTITATAPDKSKDTCKLIIVTPTEGVKMNKTSASIYVGKTVSLKASLTTKGSNEPVFWTSSNPSVATVSTKGVVKGIKQGKVTITATTFNGKKTTATVTVMTKAATLEFTKTTPALYMDGNTGKFTVAITSPAKSNDTITWSTSNKNVISIERISADGKTITIKSGKKGTATITARAGSGKKITYKVTSVNQAADSITLNKYSADIYVGNTVSLKTSKITPRGCNDVVIWESSDESIATVTPDGKVKGISQGTVTICANSFGGVTNEVTIKVRSKAKAIDASAESDTIKVGESTTVSVTSISPENCNDTLTWSTSSKSIASAELNSDGKSVIVTGLKKGTVTITVKTGSGKSKKVKIVVTQ